MTTTFVDRFGFLDREYACSFGTAARQAGNREPTCRRAGQFRSIIIFFYRLAMNCKFFGTFAKIQGQSLIICVKRLAALFWS
jgi:hypothetical protein